MPTLQFVFLLLSAVPVFLCVTPDAQPSEPTGLEKPVVPEPVPYPTNPKYPMNKYRRSLSLSELPDEHLKMSPFVKSEDASQLKPHTETSTSDMYDLPEISASDEDIFNWKDGKWLKPLAQIIAPPGDVIVTNFAEEQKSSVSQTLTSDVQDKDLHRSDFVGSENTLKNVPEFPNSEEDDDIFFRDDEEPPSGESTARLQKINRLISFDINMKNKPEPEPRSGLITAYRQIAKNDEVKPMHFKGYTALRMWCLFRHGARAPDVEDIKIMQEELPRIRTILREEARKAGESKKHCYTRNLERWTMHNEILGCNKSLVTEGKKEMKELGQRYRKRFGNLLPSTFDESIKVRLTDSGRTIDSADNFLAGMFEILPEGYKSQYLKVPKNDRILQFDAGCPFWRAMVKKTWFHNILLGKFSKTKQMQSVVTGFNERCGFEKPAITEKGILLIYETCCYESACDPSLRSAWCSLLHEDDKKVIEYKNDIIFYANDGYGSELSRKIACVMFNDMVDHLLGKGDYAKHKVTLNFTHIRILLKFTAHLGLYRDRTLRYTAMEYEKSDNRQWRTTKIGAYSMNFSFTLYESDTVNADGIKEKFVLVMHQEQIVHIPGCPESYKLCPWDKFVEIFASSIHDCDYDKLCKERPELQESFAVPEHLKSKREKEKEKKEKLRKQKRFQKTEQNEKNESGKSLKSKKIES